MGTKSQYPNGHHPNSAPARKLGSAAASRSEKVKAAGHKQGGINRANGHMSAIGEQYGPAQAKKLMATKTGLFGQSAEQLAHNQALGRHVYWHEMRDRFQPKCEFCLVALDTPAVSGNPA